MVIDKCDMPMPNIPSDQKLPNADWCSEKTGNEKIYEYIVEKPMEIKNIPRPNLESNHLRKALIMAGGFGTRMKELTKDTPKPMLLLQEKPILEYSIDLCKRYGIRDIAISIYHFGDKIKEYFGDGSKFGVHIVYVEETSPLGTGGALKLFEHWLNEPFMMCNADELKDINLQEMYIHHMLSNSLATIALTRVEDPTQYGVVDLQGSKITRFVEKPSKEEAPSNFINAGLYIIEPEAIKFIPDGFTMVEKDLFPMLAKNDKLNGFKFSGQWFDTGTKERYEDTEKNWKGFKEVMLKEESTYSNINNDFIEDNSITLKTDAKSIDVNI